MAATWQSVSTDAVTTSGQTSLAPAKPSGLAVGDLILGIGHCVNGRTLSAPAGWTVVSNDAGTGTEPRVYVWTRVADSGDAAASTFAFTTNGTSSTAGVSLHRVSGASTGTPTTAFGTGTNSTSQTAPTLTTPSANCLLFWGFFHASSNASTATASKGTERVDAASTNGGMFATYTDPVASAGSVTGAVMTTTAFGAKRVYSIAVESSGGDATAPVVSSASVDTAGTTLTINFTEAGSAPVLPASSVTGFTLTASGGAATLSSTAISGTTYTATISRSIAQGETITLAYAPGNVTDSATSPNSLASFSGTAVTNNSTVDTTAPTVTARSIDAAGTTLSVTFSESVAGGTGFTLSGGHTLGSASGSGTGRTFSISPTVYSTDTRTLSYSPGDVADAASNALASFSGAAVVNNSTQVDPAGLAAGTASFVASGTAGISVSATAPTGGSGTITYQWERNASGGSYSDLSGATSLTLTDATATAGTLYGYRLKQTRSAVTVTTNAITAQVYAGGALTGGGYSRSRAVNG